MLEATQATCLVPDDPGNARSGRVAILGCKIDPVTMSDAVDRCDALIEAGHQGQYLAINAAKLVAMQDDSELRRIADQSELVTADGQSIVWAARFLKRPLPGRVTGIDLMEHLIELAESKGYRVFILGARPDVLDRAVVKLRQRYPRLTLAGYRDGFFRDSEDEEVCVQIRAAKPDILLVAMSSPRKEYWLGARRHALGVPLLMGVGGAIDVVAGQTRRAPMLVQRAGLEWLFRVMQEPRRLGRRYIVTNARFLWLVVRARWSHGSGT